MAGQNSGSTKVSRIELILRDSDRRSLLLHGYGLTSGIVSTPHLLAIKHQETFGCSVDETFARHWAYYLGKKSEGMPEEDAEVLACTAYDVVVATESSMRTRRSAFPRRPVEPVTEFVNDLNFDIEDFLKLRGNMKALPRERQIEGIVTVAGCVYAVLPLYKRKA